MIIRQTMNFAAHLLAGAAMGALAVLAARGLCRRDRADVIEPRYPPTPPQSAAATGAERGLAAETPD
jgi:hypothetical protein